MLSSSPSNKRVILVHWKKDTSNPFEVFSNLKNFCLSYNQFNYNTINNYLSKAKIPYENDELRIERKIVILKPKAAVSRPIRRIAPVVRKVLMQDANDEIRDFEYWLSKSVQDRAAAITAIISQSLVKGQRIDKTKVTRRHMHDTGRRF